MGDFSSPFYAISLESRLKSNVNGSEINHQSIPNFVDLLPFNVYFYV